MDDAETESSKEEEIKRVQTKSKLSEVQSIAKGIHERERETDEEIC